MLCAPFYTMLCTCLVKTLYGINYNNNTLTVLAKIYLLLITILTSQFLSMMRVTDMVKVRLDEGFRHGEGETL